MLQLFPNRTRRDLKIKFKKEEKSNGHLIDKALCNPKAFDVESLRKEFEKEDADRAEKQARLEEEAEKKRAQRETLRKRRNAEVKNIQKSNPQKWISRTGRSMTSADDIYAIVDGELDPPAENLKASVKQEPRELSPVPLIQTEPLATTTIDQKPLIIDEDEAEELSESEQSNSIMEDLDWDSLVLCTAQNSETGTVTYAVYLRDPSTGALGKEPLDLPDSIIEILKQHYEEDVTE